MQVRSNDHSHIAVCLLSSMIPIIIGAYTLSEPFGRDQGIHATIAFSLQSGLTTYLDVFNIKPPMTTAMHWLALEIFGHSIFSIRYLDMLFVMLGMACLTSSILRLGYEKIIALGASIGFSSMYYSLTYWEHAQTDEWAIICIIICFFFLTVSWKYSVSYKRFIFIFLAGVFIGIGFSYKYTIAVTGILVFTPLLVKEDSIQFYWRDLFWFIVGGGVFLCFIIIILLATDSFVPFIEIQNFLRGYLNYNGSMLHLLSAPVTIALGHSIVNGTLVLFGAGMVVAGFFRQKTNTLHVTAIILTLCGGLSGYVQGKGFIYHFIPILFGYSLFFGYAVNEVLIIIKKRFNINLNYLISSFVLVVIVILDTGTLRINTFSLRDAFEKTPLETRFNRYDINADYSFPDTLKFSNMLSEIRQPDEDIFIWGYETGLYFLQETPPKYRYPYIWPFSVDFYDGRYTSDLLDRLKRSPPKYFVVQKNDATPWVTGHGLDSQKILQNHLDVNNYLIENYEKILQTDRFNLWENNNKQQ